MADQQKNGYELNTNGHASAEQGKWVIMVYLAADAVLAGFAIESLKQLQATASRDVLVIVQFDAPQQKVRRLIFDGAFKTGSINKDIKGMELGVGTNMADPKTLADFIHWAYALPEGQGHKHYALILWGHGPELLLDDYVVPGSKRTRKSFLNPAQLASGLEMAHKSGGPKFDIIAADACSMSSLEVLCELETYSNYFIASQEDVPDFSFPYNQLLPSFQKSHDVAALCRAIPDVYISAYHDFVRNSQTAMKPVTLTSFSLAHEPLFSIRDGVSDLAALFLHNVNDENLSTAVVRARKCSRSFVSGLYVDLLDFCDKLGLAAGDNVSSACQNLRDALQQGSARCILENQSQDPLCHGLSIYFPFADPDENTVGPLAPMIKGSSTDVLNKGSSTDVLNKGSSTDVLNKGSSTDVLNKSGADILRTVRLQSIQDTESYYPRLQIAGTQWYHFIQSCWSRWLAKGVREAQRKSPDMDVSGILDQQYSAQQCALNLLSCCGNGAGPKRTGAGYETAPESQRDDLVTK